MVSIYQKNANATSENVALAFYAFPIPEQKLHLLTIKFPWMLGGVTHRYVALPLSDRHQISL